jgi:hypothetical protein
MIIKQEARIMNRLILATLILISMAVSLPGCTGQQAKPAAPPAVAPNAPQNPTPAVQPSQSSSNQDLVLEIDEPDDESVVKVSTISLSGTASPDAEVTVNGISVNVDKGNFTTMIELEEGPNSIEILASDAKGHKNSQVLTVIYIP